MRLAVPTLSVVILTLACGGSSGGGITAPAQPTPTTCPIPVAKTNPTWKADIYPFIQSSCGSNSPLSCHDGASPLGHVAYSGTSDQVYARLVGIAPTSAPPGQGWVLVKPGDTSRSWLFEKVTKDQPGGSGYGTRMPQAAPNLCQPTLDTLSAWISAGALNN